jgi:sterol desaturase/sphingolipid hydroxylase (fatty acid hydroxylase superfamily)
MACPSPLPGVPCPRSIFRETTPPPTAHSDPQGHRHARCGKTVTDIFWTSTSADVLLYCFTAMITHSLMSLGQTLFHRYLGHTRLGGRFFTNHIQFHHGHYFGDHVISSRYLDNGDNNTLFFMLPVALIIALSCLLLRLDLFIVQATVTSLSFCGHYYLDNQYHIMGSWLCRFSWFRRKQRLHFVHHRQADCNFAVIDYFWDRLLGTYRSSEAARYELGR